MDKKESSSWEHVSEWYNRIVGEKGHEQHRIVIPKILGLIGLLNKKDKGPFSLLDVGCGEGVVTRYLLSNTSYLGIDLSPRLLAFAQKKKKRKEFSFLKADATETGLDLQQIFTHALALFSLQNMKDGQTVFQNVAKHLHVGGKFGCVINHPAFRIPRNSHWCVDTNQKRIFRRVDYYLSSLEVPILATPSQGKQSSATWSYHVPLSTYFDWASQARLRLINFEEWINENGSRTDKKMARAAKEFPLFAALVFQRY
ncbi:class I SAM-dependent methyltransferase [Candidatus Similichlamydia laticola]|nr:class I SAM-dependent methyltransferase [Candidatus Similichlamydia laticola]